MPKSVQAYSIVDISEFHDEAKQALLEDAEAGGKVYGLTVVEQYVNGPMRSSVYGYYDAELWEAGKKELGIDQGEEELDEEQLRKKAEEEAAAAAELAQRREEAALKAVTEAQGDGKRRRS